MSGGNLTSVCKLVFKISKEEKHDSLFLENNILGKLINIYKTTYFTEYMFVCVCVCSTQLFTW